MKAPQWREEAGGTLVAETAKFTIKVRRTARRQHVRFVVLKRTDVLVGSGATADIAAAMNAAETMAERLSVTRKSNKPRLMVVDNDQEMRGAIADTLRDGGHDVMEAASGEGALRRLERLSQPVALVTALDLSGGMDGLELAVSARKLLPGTAILLISDDRRPAGRTVNERVLRKPFSADQLLERVAELINRTRSRTQSLMHRPIQPVRPAAFKQ
jgi:CheY-like chemotaxis protein